MGIPQCCDTSTVSVAVEIRQDEIDELRIWDWSALLGICSGVVAAAAWYFVDNGHQSPPPVPTGPHLAVAVPSTVWWLPFILGVVFGALGLALQLVLARANLLGVSTVRRAIVVLGCGAGGLAAAGAVWAVPQQLVFQEAIGHRTSISPSPVYFVVLPMAGVAVGVVLAVRQRNMSKIADRPPRDRRVRRTG